MAINNIKYNLNRHYNLNYKCIIIYLLLIK